MLPTDTAALMKSASPTGSDSPPARGNLVPSL